MSDEYFMKEAIEEAKIALKEGNWPIGCVIELNGEVISRAHNQVYTKNDKTAHAEMLAIKKAQNILQNNKEKATLYTTYEPCPMCFGAIILNRIKRVVSGINLDGSGAMFLRDNLPGRFKKDKFYVEFIEGVLAKECYDIFIQGEPSKKLLNKT